MRKHQAGKYYALNLGIKVKSTPMVKQISLYICMSYNLIGKTEGIMLDALQ